MQRAVEFNPESMKAQPPDVPAARQLFTELEFTSLVKEFLEESTEIGETDYREAKSARDVETVFAAVPAGGALAWAIEATAPAESEETASVTEEAAEEAVEDDEEQQPLFSGTQGGLAGALQKVARARAKGNSKLPCEDRRE